MDEVYIIYTIYIYIILKASVAVIATLTCDLFCCAIGYTVLMARLC